MRKKYSVAQARACLPSIIDEVALGGNVELTRRGKPVAIFVSIGEYERLSSEGVSFSDAYAAYKDKWEGVPSEVFRHLRESSEGRKVRL